MAAKKSRKTNTRRKARPQAQRVQTRMLTPYLAVGDAGSAIDWYKKAFGAKELSRQLEPSGKVMHAALKIGDSNLFLSDLFPGTDMRDPREGGTTVNLHIYSKDIDRIWKRAVEAGAKVTMPLENQFWGDRYGKLQDPFGHSWGFNYPAKMSKAEMERKREEAFKQMGPGEHPGNPEGGQP